MCDLHKKQPWGPCIAKVSLSTLSFAEYQSYWLLYVSLRPMGHDPYGSHSTRNGSHHWYFHTLEILERVPRTQVVSLLFFLHVNGSIYLLLQTIHHETATIFAAEIIRSLAAISILLWKSKLFVTNFIRINASKAYTEQKKKRAFLKVYFFV